MISSNFSYNSANLFVGANPLGFNSNGGSLSSREFVTNNPVEPLAESGANQLRARERSVQTPANNVNGEGAFTSEDNAAEETAQNQQAELEERLAQEQLRRDQETINQLAARDREVRAHEQAHAAVGGQYAGAPTYQYERGPNGVRYAVGGEVPIDTGKEATPEETIQKAQVVRRAALAPAEPSPQDRRVAAEASRLESDARQELAVQRREETQQAQDERAASGAESADASNVSESTESTADAQAIGFGNANNVVTINAVTNNRISSLANTQAPPAIDLPSSVNFRLNQVVQTASLQSPNPGRILDEIV